MTTITPAAAPTVATNAIGSSGEGLFVLAGVVVAAAGWRANHAVSEWLWRVVIGTAGLAILASMTNRTRMAPVVKGVAWLTFLAACIYSIPVFQSSGVSVGKTGKDGSSPAPKGAKNGGRTQAPR